jgi:hypothetical protein
MLLLVIIVGLPVVIIILKVVIINLKKAKNNPFGEKIRMIVRIAGLFLCVTFFVAPLVQCSQDSSINATGLEIAAGTGKLMGNAEKSYPFVFVLLIPPLIIAGFAHKSFTGLRNISIGGLAAQIGFMIGTYTMLNSGKRESAIPKGAYELTIFNWLIIAAYIGLIVFLQYYNKQKMGRALGQCGLRTQVNQRCPDETKALIQSGIAHFQVKEYEAAIADFTDVIGINPQIAAAWYNRGCAWYGKGDRNRACADFERAAMIEPDNARYREGLEKARRAAAQRRRPEQSGGRDCE